MSYLHGSIEEYPTPRQEHGVAILLIPAVDIFIASMQAESAAGLLAVIVSGILCASAFYLLVKGFAVEQAFHKRLGKRPKLPRKIIGSVLAALSIGVLAVFKTSEILPGVQYGLGCFVLSLISFGFDPVSWRKSSTTTAAERLQFQLAAVTAKLDLAETEVRGINDPKLVAAFERYRDAVDGLIAAVRAAPERARSVKRHLGPLIDGALDAGRAFLKSRTGVAGNDGRDVMVDLLTELEREYEQATHDYAAANMDGLKRDAEVLREMLMRVRPASQ